MVAPSESSPQRRYRLIAEIGRGGMAEVYLAISQGPGGFNKLIVIKKALKNLALQPEFLAMFLDEARLAARMNHPNVVQTYEFGEEEGRQFIAMEYLDGQPYSRVMSRLRGRTGGLETMSLAHHLRAMIDTLSGLHHAHELKDFDGSPLYVVHRDVTPQNVFITYDGSIKVVDFGIAKAQDSSSRTVTGEIKGKVTYMSPEQVRGEPLDRRSDLFAVGVMLWEAVSGRRMWADLPDASVVHELLSGRIPSIRTAEPRVPAELARIIERALDTDREGRYPSALAMQRELEDFVVSSGARVDGPEVGRVVSELFEEERRRVKAVVEAQIGSLRWTGENFSAANLPVIPAPPSSLSSGGAQVTNSGASVPMPLHPVAARRVPTVPLIGGAVAILLLGAIVVLTIARPWNRGAAPSAARAAETTAAAASSSASDSVTLKVRATPAEAKIYLDGVLMGTGTFEGKVSRGDAPRVLRIEADGYQPKEEKVALTGDLMTSFALEKLDTDKPVASSASASSSASGSPAGGPPRPLGPHPPPRTGTGRGIDSESPYGHP